MDRFLRQSDQLGTRIQDGATRLHQKLSGLDVESLSLPAHCLYYFKASHSKRLFFSIQTSAELLYRAISLSGKKVEEIVLMDYGAGVGTLYLLASEIGCGSVVYNDHLEDWKISARLIAESIKIRIDHYFVGDIEQTLDDLDKLSIKCDVITSRNVIEHIYRLDKFYQQVQARQPGAIVFSSTTANRQNPAAYLKHYNWHRKWEKAYAEGRKKRISEIAPKLPESQKLKLTKATRGMAAEDITRAVELFEREKVLPNPSIHATNTCDPDTGVWAERLLSLKLYREIIDERKYDVSFAPGFWDTHYKSGLMNIFAKILNGLIQAGGGRSLLFAPFIYVIARPR